MRKIKYIACKGGGVRICAYAGAAVALDEAGVLYRLKGVSGTSAGAIFATLVSLGYTGNEIQEIIMGYDFSKFKDRTIVSILTAFRDYGYCKGEYFLKQIEKVIEAKTGNKNTTFEELKLKGFKDLRVYATGADNYNSACEFSFTATPKVRVADAVRASMSIPGIYKAYKINGRLYIDGGVTYNYPINAFDETFKCSNDEVLGLFLFNQEHDEEIKMLTTGHPFKYLDRLFKSMLKAQDIAFFKDYENIARSVIIDTKGVSSTDFSIKNDTKKMMFGQGYLKLKAFISACKLSKKEK